MSIVVCVVIDWLLIHFPNSLNSLAAYVMGLTRLFMMVQLHDEHMKASCLQPISIGCTTRQYQDIGQSDTKMLF